jgi:hypothetical protein
MTTGESESTATQTQYATQSEVEELREKSLA